MNETAFEIKYVDTENKLAQIRSVDLPAELEKLRLAINAILKNMKQVDTYDLSEITASIGVKCGVLIFEANGSIQLKWTKAKP